MTPESRIEMLEDRSAFVDRKDETQDPSGFAAIVVEYVLAYIGELKKRRSAFWLWYIES